MSRRKRSLSILSFDLMSHNRQEFGRDFVGDDDPHHLVFPQPAALHLEVDETDADAEEEPGKEVVDPDGERHDVVDLLRRGPAEGGDVLFGHHRVVERIILVIEFDDRARQLRAFLDPELLRQGAGGDIAHDDLERNNLDLTDQLLAHVEPADEMGRHPNIVEMLEYVLRDTIIEDPLALDNLVLFRIEGGRVVLEMLDQRSGLGSFVKDLGLAFVNATAAAHRSVPWFVKVHVPWAPFQFEWSAAAEPDGTTCLSE